MKFSSYFTSYVRPSFCLSKRFTKSNFIRSSLSIEKLLYLRNHQGFKGNSYQSTLKRLKVLRSPEGFRYLNNLHKFLKTVYNYKSGIDLILSHVNHIEFLILHHGYNRAAKILKNIYSYAERYTSGHKPNRVEFVKTIKNSDFPKCLYKFKELLDDTDSNSKIACLTILDIHRLYGTGILIPDITGIIKEGVVPRKLVDTNTFKPGNYFNLLSKVTGDPFWISFGKEWKRTLENEFPKSDSYNRISDLINLSTIHISSKAGPNGTALASSVFDYKAIRNSICSDGYTRLIDHVLDMASMTGNSNLIKILNHYKRWYEEVPNLFVSSHSPYYTGRLSIKQEHSGKSRFIAIVDTFTQSSLKGMHKFHGRWLRNQHDDGTYDQDKSFKIFLAKSARKFDKNFGLSSQDLTEASNALDAALSAEIINQQFHSEIASTWFSLCTDREFYSPELEKSFRYVTGQPMGTYTSWSTLAITNHMIARTCCNMLKLNYKRNILYQIIGDDFVCQNLKLGELYSKVFNAIGVKVSVNKGFTYQTNTKFIESNNLNSIENTFELAKRIGVNGVELTPIRPKILKLGLTHPIYFNQLLNEMYQKNIRFNPYFIDKLASLCYDPKSSYIHAISPISPCFYLRDLYENFKFDDKLEDVGNYLLLNSDIEYSSYKREFKVNLYDELRNINLTFNDFRNTYKYYLGSLIGKRIKPSLAKINKILFEGFYKDIEDRPQYSRSNNIFILSNGYKSLDLYLWLIYIKSIKLIKDSINDLSKEELNEKDFKDIILNIVSIQDFSKLLIKSRKLPTEIKESNILNDCCKIITDSIINGSDSENGKIPLNFEDLKDIIDNKIDKNNFIVNDSFLERLKLRGPFTKEESSFLNTEEGFLSVLSPAVRSAMRNLMKSLNFSLGDKVDKNYVVDSKVKSYLLNITFDDNLRLPSGDNFDLFFEDIDVNNFNLESIYNPDEISHPFEEDYS